MRLRVCIGIWVLISFVVHANAQGQRNIWLFGDRAGLNFNMNPPSTFSTNIRFKGWSCNTICDSAGNMLFFTDGDTVWDKNYNVMPNGTGMNYLGTNFKPAIIIPSSKFNQFFLITVVNGAGLENPSMLYSIIDMGMNNGLGGIVKKKNVLNPIASTSLNAVQHANGKDIWLLTHEGGTNNYLAYLIKDSVISTSPVRSSIGRIYDTIVGIFPDSRLKFSADGRSCINFIGAYYNGEIMHFDISSGKFSHWFTLGYKDTIIGLPEFSPDGTKLYITKSASNGYSIVQFDLSLGDTSLIKKSLIIIAKRAFTNNPFADIQLAPDGKIYISYYYAPYLAVISNPNALANKVQFDTAGMLLKNVNSYGNLPLQPTFNQIPIAKFTYSPNCFGDSIKFIGMTNRANPKFIWDFGDPASSVLDTITTQKPSHAYKKPGNYTVKLTVDANGFKDSISKTIIVKPSVFSLGNDTILCEGTSYNLNATILNGKYLWSTGDTTSSIKVNSGGTYWVKVSSGNCSRYDTVQIRYINPYLNLGKDTSICKDGSIVLDAQIDSASYLWSTGATTKTLIVRNAGRYSVKVRKGGCTTSDSILINPAPQPSRNTPYHVILCPETGQTDTLDAGAAQNYLWSPGKETSRIKIFRDTGIYTLTTSNSYGCIRTDTIVTIRKCPPLVVYPNAFSPNNDSLNNVFLPLGRDVLEYELWIYNRWGELVFHSNAFNEGWDGMYKGAPCPEGVYMYKVQYSGYGKPQWTKVFRTGTVHLAR